VWTAALKAVDPESAVRKFVKRDGSILRIGRNRFNLDKVRKLWVLGAGKAAAPMGRAVERILGHHIAGGFLITKYGHSLPLKKLEVAEAGHPLPDSGSVAAGKRFLALADRRIVADDLVICLFSGGASSLLVSPASGITLKDKLLCTKLLLNSGAGIHELNAVRKHLSKIKGGGLARALSPTRVVSLVLSDVVGDDPATIASGPMAADPTTYDECLAILRKFRLLRRIPPAVRRRLDLGAAGKIGETPKEGDPAFAQNTFHIIGSCAQVCTAAARAARRLGYQTLVITSRLEGDTGEAARFHMSVADEIALHRRPVKRPACIISGGETTVRVRGKGKGGRNQEFVLHCVKRLSQMSVPCVVSSLGTDGTDGPTDAAGAIADNTTLLRSIQYERSLLSKSLRDNDSYHFFERLGDLIITGPTRTNVMDLHIVLIG